VLGLAPAFVAALAAFAPACVTTLLSLALRLLLLPMRRA
jgi:hypothetical protein